MKFVLDVALYCKWSWIYVTEKDAVWICWSCRLYHTFSWMYL